MKRLVFLIVACVFSAIASAQSVNSLLDIGVNHTITSQVLKQDRIIHIYVPEGYETSEKEYPTFYILDGQWYYTNGVAIQKTLRTPGMLPEMIVVGIVNKSPLREELFSNDRRQDFLSFLKEEVVAYVDQNYRTSDDRVLFGWENGAYFACYALLSDQKLFNAVIATNGAYASEKTINEYDKLQPKKDKYLFVANTKKDIYSIQYSDAFIEFLKKIQPKKLIWKNQYFNDEVHESLPYLAMYHGLKYYYHNYPSLDFASTQEFNDLGGVPYLKSYFKGRGERYGYSTEIDNGTKNTLIWLAWNRDNFEHFSLFMNEFKDVLDTKRYQSGYWQNRLGQFYLKHNDYDNAIQFFNSGLTKFPQSKEVSEMYKGLGKAYHKKGNIKEAKKVYKKLLKIDDMKVYANEQLQLLKHI